MMMNINDVALAREVARQAKAKAVQGVATPEIPPQQVKTYVISLPSRADRKAVFSEKNADYIESYQIHDAFDGRNHTYEQLVGLGWDTDKDWRDPMLDRVLTRGEIGCFISHYQLWEMCAAGTERFVILEDDVVFTSSMKEALNKLEQYEFGYFTYKEMQPEAVEEINGDLVKPSYAYWLAAYTITPAAAQKLIETDIRQNIIPCDEYVPRLSLDVAALKEPCCTQMSRSEMGTDIEPTSESDYIVDFTTYVLTCGSDESRMEMLEESANRTGVKVQNIFNIGSDVWGGGTMEGPGGGQKLRLLQRFIDDNNLPDNDVVLFTDAYDVIYLRDLETILGRFLGFKHEVIFSAEQYLWPDTSVRFPPAITKYRYLNSGTFIGRVGELKRMLQKPILDSDDDQLYIQRAFLTGRYDAVLDHEGYIFQCHEEQLNVRDGNVYNPLTGCFPCVYHANGGPEMKAKMEVVYRQVFPVIKYAQTDICQVIGQEMILIDFMTPTQCDDWIKISEAHGGFAPHEADKFPSHDIHLKELGLWEEMEAHWRMVIAPITDNYWKPSLHYHLRKAFVMKYSLDTQRTLGLHTDASLVTGSVKLNDDYEGATLIFPRQNVTNRDIPVGKMLLFPGPLTHGHHVDPLTRGTKYSATFWTARYKGDLLDPS